jgi:hypothetical protein
VFEVEFGVTAELVRDPKLVALATDGGLRFARRVRFVVRQPLANVEAFFDAETDELIVSYNIAAARTGEAQVHAINPLRTPGVVTVSLTRLNEHDDGHLSGPAIDVLPGVPPRLKRLGGHYLLNAPDTGFDEVQAFYHVGAALDFFERYLPGLGSREPFNPITAVVRDPDNGGNATWMPDERRIALGDFDGRPSARSADMIYHEVGHAISDMICKLQRGPRHTEARGLAEGYSDFFACSALDDPRFGDYVSDEPDGARRCDRPGLRFPPDYRGREHQTGEVWAGVLWDCRGQLGSDHMNALAIESLTHLTRTSTFEAGFTALRDADVSLHTAAGTQDQIASHAAIIDAAFDSRRP